MTEQQREEELLSELLDLPEYPDQRRANDTTISQPFLTRSEEQALLRAANQAGTPTLAPPEVGQAPDDAPHSFVSDLAGVARKYPVLTVLAAGSIAFLLARRRR
ncbi:MAG: hypothetical protein M3R61_06420 [Chloroflexota bacterium]|nr:hypothetical protein [Chloroflexota bacterium]